MRLCALNSFVHKFIFFINLDVDRVQIPLPRVKLISVVCRILHKPFIRFAKLLTLGDALVLTHHPSDQSLIDVL